MQADDDKPPLDPAQGSATPPPNEETPKRAGKRAKRDPASRTHRTRRKGGRTPESERKFLAALGVGKSIAAAARAAGVGRQTVYDWRDTDPAFAIRWDGSLETGTDYLEDLALKQAKKGSERLLLALLRARRPERYARSLLEHSGSLETILRDAGGTLDAKLARLGQP